MYEVLATLWNEPSTDLEVARAVEDRLGVPCSRNQADTHLRVLRTCGYVAARAIGGAPRFVLTENGSALLARYALQREITEL
jgi:hypothetical protein